MDAQTLAANMVTAAANQPVTTMKMDMVMDMGMEFASMAMSMSVKTDMTMDMKIDSAAQTYYADMNMNMSVMGQETTETAQTYVLSEGGNIVTYTYSETNGTWTRQETPNALEQSTDMNGMTDFLETTPAEQLTLEENTQQLGGREVYVLRYTMTGDQMDMDMSAFEELMSGLGTDVSGLDLSQMEVPVTMYVDAETFLVVQYEMDASGMEDLMNTLVKSMMDSTAETEAVDMTVTFNEFSMAATNIGYEKVEVPQVPAEGIQRADLPAYLIEESAASVTVFAAEEYTPVESDYYYIGLMNEDGSQYIYYSLYTDAEFVEFFGEGDVAGFGYPNGGEGPDLNGYKTLWATDSGVNIYFAWIQIGDCKLVVESYDYFGQSDLESVMVPLLEAVFSSQLNSVETL